MIFFWIFNYTTAIYSKDTLTSKVTNSFAIGVYLMIYQMIYSVSPKNVGEVEETSYIVNIAKCLSYICGMLNFLGNFMIFSAYDEATKSGQNVGIVTAICQGSTFFGLLGSVFIYKETITVLQGLGSVLSVCGIIGLSVL